MQDNNTQNSDNTQADTSPYSSPDSEVINTESQEFAQMEIFSTGQRIGRIRFLAYNSAVTLIFMAIAVIFGIFVGVTSAGSASGLDMMMGSAGIVMILLYIAMFAASFIIARRRLHDLGHTGWMSLLYLVPLVNLIFGLYVLFAPGEKATNKYGLRPPANTTGNWILALLMPVLLGLMIFAAILPAFQGM